MARIVVLVSIRKIQIDSSWTYYELRAPTLNLLAVWELKRIYYVYCSKVSIQMPVFCPELAPSCSGNEDEEALNFQQEHRGQHC